MSTFAKWYDDADMPEKVDGRWVDLETGIPYEPFAVARLKLSDKAANARAVAKFFGGKALKGSAKQKEWAEKIRAEKISGMSEEAASLIVDPNGLCSHSKFWIENRDKPAHEFEEFITEQKALLRTARARAAGGEDCASLAERYNALTAAWGF